MVSRPLPLPRPLASLVREGAPPGRHRLEALLEGARRGDARAFGQVRRRVEPQLTNFVRTFASLDEDLVHDVVHETFTTAWRHLERIRDAEHLRPWLFRVARFKAIDVLRRRGPKGEAMQSLEYAAERGADLPDPGLVDPLRRAMTMDASNAWLEALRRAVPRLPPIYRGVVRLYYLEDLSAREVAELMGLPLTTVKMRLLRGRKRLRDLILEELGGEEPDL